MEYYYYLYNLKIMNPIFNHTSGTCTFNCAPLVGCAYYILVYINISVGHGIPCLLLFWYTVWEQYRYKLSF
jgi:hypothetical protein